MIAIIDYGLGNLRSVEKAFEKEGFKCVITKDKEIIDNADGMVLPGVGAFSDAVGNLKKVGLFSYIKDWIKEDRPFLGICLGFQLLFEYSEEADKSIKGLDIFKGVCKRFKIDKNLKVPQIGWNDIEIVKKESNIFKGIDNNSYVYFVHSYYVDTDDENIICAKTYYGLEFISAVSYGNIFATQFHPEKSGDIGLKMISNFGELTKEMRK